MDQNMTWFLFLVGDTQKIKASMFDGMELGCYMCETGCKNKVFPES